MAAAWDRAKKLAKTMVTLSRDPRIPRPVRWLLVFAVLPIPGPFDELVGFVAVGLIAIFWRPVLREVMAQQEAASPPTDPPTGLRGCDRPNTMS